jgi:hypothetical protein
MSAMIQADYHAEFETQVSHQKVFQAINQVSAWWTKNTEGSTKALNDIFTVRFGETYSRIQITEMIPEQKIVWKVLDCNLHWMKNKKEWKDTGIVWEIFPMNDTTRIAMTHVGLKPGIECFEDCQKGWNHYVKESLFRLINEGKGVPDHKDYSALERQ